MVQLHATRLIPALTLMVAATALPAQQTIAQISFSNVRQNCTSAVQVAKGDLIYLEADLRIGSGGPGPTTLAVTTRSGRSARLGAGNRSYRANYTAGNDSHEQLCGTIGNWDLDDSAVLSIKRGPRANINVKAITLSSANQTVQFGYEVGSVALPNFGDPHLTLSYGAFQGGQWRLADPPLESRPIQRGANSREVFSVSYRSFGPAPSGATHLVATIRGADFAESNDNDDVDGFLLPKLKVLDVDRDGKTGKLNIKVDFTRGDDQYPLLTPTLKVFSRDDANISGSISGQVLLFSSLVTHAGINTWSVDPNDYRLPLGSNTRLYAVVDPAGSILQTDLADNSMLRPLDGISGWRLVSQTPGVDVYYQRFGGQDPMFLSVSRLPNVRLVSQVHRRNNVSFATHLAQWNILNSATQRVRLVINGTFFSPNVLLPASTLRFTHGLKASDGSGVNDTGASADSTTSLLVFDGNRQGSLVGVRPHSASLFSLFPDLVGVREGSRVPMDRNPFSDGAVPRQWVGVRDASAIGYQTFLTLTSIGSNERRDLVKLLLPWGVPQNQQFELDGGGATSLMVPNVIERTGLRGNRLAPSTLPHTIALVEDNRLTTPPANVNSAQSRRPVAPTPEELLERVRQNWHSHREVVYTAAQAHNHQTTLRLRVDGSLDELSASAQNGWTRIMTNAGVRTIVSCRGEILAISNDGGTKVFRNGFFEDAVFSAPGPLRQLACKDDIAFSLTESGTLFQRIDADWVELAEGLLDIAATQSAIIGRTRTGNLVFVNDTASTLPLTILIAEIAASGDTAVALDASGRLLSIGRSAIREIASNCRQIKAIGDGLFTQCHGQLFQINGSDTGPELDPIE